MISTGKSQKKKSYIHQKDRFNTDGGNKGSPERRISKTRRAYEDVCVYKEKHTERERDPTAVNKRRRSPLIGTKQKRSERERERETMGRRRSSFGCVCVCVWGGRNTHGELCHVPPHFFFSYFFFIVFFCFFFFLFFF